MIKNLKVIWINICLLLLFLIDRLIKWKVSNISFKSDFFIFYKNPGIAFSIPIPENLFLYFYILVFLILILLIYFIIYSYKRKNTLLYLSNSLLFFGALSNLIDRSLSGFIIDYIDLGFLPVFNIADMMVVGGVVLLILNKFKIKIK